MRLHSRVYLHSLMVLLVVGAATSLVFALGGRGGFAREMGERLARHAGGLAAERLDDRAALARRLQQLNAELGVDVVVRDLEGRPLAAAGAPLPSPAPDALAAARAGHAVARGGPPALALAPVRDPASGAVVATIELAPEHRFGPAGLLRPLLMVALVLGVVAAVTRPLSRRLSRPVERLTEAARRLGGGDLTARVPVTPARRWWQRPRAPADEIGELTRAFNDMAERVQRLVRGEKELLANVSHELRSPLARLRMALALMPRPAADEARLVEAERDLAELERLIDDVLATARLDATGLPTHLGEVDARALMAAVAERARHDPAVAGREVRVGETAPVIFVADEALLRRALGNLVENAAKYGAPPITLSAERLGDALLLAVEDEGPGIPVDARERVLDPFQRLDTARTPDGAAPRGFGLGLTFARRVAEVHGGRITVGGGPERGCRVTLRLPLGESA
ncbi:MAG TPA: HAMP domain-containing sensor histidine kinase [Candidatus Binatia bacterium]|nr:HAMP domain-containing sensor histidine kinase [Candidatus Binatia bacterium]